jgi:small nuclear ribonucleoprotein (snRNP)-like protein
MAEVNPGISKKPADFLKSIRGKPVIVKLSSGVDYRGVAGNREHTQHLGRDQNAAGSLITSSPVAPSGILACLDGYMNIALEQTEVKCILFG